MNFKMEINSKKSKNSLLIKKKKIIKFLINFFLFSLKRYKKNELNLNEYKILRLVYFNLFKFHHKIE
jgi:hypothetical protein